MPVRKGTAAEPRRFVKGWMNLEFGVTSRAKISEFYGKEVVEAIIGGVEGFDRWGFAQGKGGLVSKIYGTKAIPEILKKCLDGEINAKQAARMMNEKVRGLDQGR